MRFKISGVRIKNNYIAISLLGEIWNIIGHDFADSFSSVIGMYNKIVYLDVFAWPEFDSRPKTG